MSESVAEVVNLILVTLADSSPTADELRETISDFRLMSRFRWIDDDQAEEIAREFEERRGISMLAGDVLVHPDFEPWLDARRSDLDLYYWNRYKLYLQRQGLNNNVVSALDEATDNIVGMLQDPASPGYWDRRGLVMGHVQSGKTSNYTGVMCKAADAGYKLVVVIAGVNNNLRNQTQGRIDEGFVGRDSGNLLSSSRDQKLVGVGRLDSKRRPATFTSSRKDFNKATATSVGVPLQNMKEPAVLVIKKNVSILNNLIDWLRDQNASVGRDKISEPMLLIDDEADNASINVKYGKEGVSAINGRIRDLLELFERSCYVGYTATPFANIFIDPDSDDECLGQDLFPRDFIVSLDPPTNYVGPETIFLDRSNGTVIEIDDNQDLLPLKHKKDYRVPGLPRSLSRAMRQFVVGGAIRMARGQDSAHCSMLVNVSVYNNVQDSVRERIRDELSIIQDSTRVHGALSRERAISDRELASLFEVWDQDFASSGVEWDEIQKLLSASAGRIKVVAINSKSKDALNYSEYKTNGLSVIAVGGYSLSRGLTLEGLMISYYLRRSIMYDTLMQMGRWFGYRDGYQDLCRVWMPEEARGWYEHISESLVELRQDLRDMAAVGASPEEFGLRVRSHPDNLMITAKNKMGSGSVVVVDVGLADHLIETHILKRDVVTLSRHRRLAKQLVDDLGEAGKSISGGKGDDTHGFLFKQVDAKHITAFIAGFDNHEGSFRTYTDPVLRYIGDRVESELAEWDVLIVSLKARGPGGLDDSLGMTINCQERTAGAGVNSEMDLKLSNRQRVSSRGIERAGLSEEEVQQAKANAASASSELKNLPDYFYRKQRSRPLLMIHFVKVAAESLSTPIAEPVVAWGISFPSTKTPQKRTQYVVNTVWHNEQYGGDLDTEEMGGDE